MMRFKVEVFPHTMEGEKVVMWNACIYHLDPEEQIYEYASCTRAAPSPELADKQARALIESGQWY